MMTCCARFGDAVVTGDGTIHGIQVFVFAQDFTTFGGSLSLVHAEKICKFITGPEVIKAVTREEVSKEDLGGAMAHNARSGVAHFAAPDDLACLAKIRELMSFLPQNHMEDPPRMDSPDDPDRRDERLQEVVPADPNKPYDIREIARSNMATLYPSK